MDKDKTKDTYTRRSDLPPREFDSDLDSPALSNQDGDTAIERGSDLPNEEVDRDTPTKAHRSPNAEKTRSEGKAR